MKIFISTSSFAKLDPRPAEMLKEAGCTFDLNPHGRALNEEEIAQILEEEGYDGLLAGLEPLTENVFKRASGLKVVSRIGVGITNVDLDAAEKRGIAVRNTPGVLNDAVAELTLGLIIDGMRKISLCDRRMRAGTWKKEMGALVKGKRAGIIGLGDIGNRVAELLEGMGARVMFTDTAEKPDASFERTDLERILKECDIISLHCGGEQPILTAREFDLMKDGVMVVNMARGKMVDEPALLDALQNGKVGFAALDVFGKEPYEGPLKEMDNVVLTPHIGSYAREARVEMEKQAVLHLLEALTPNP